MGFQYTSMETLGLQIAEISQDATISTAPSDPDARRHFDQVIRKILFSKRLMPTYYLVLFVVIVLFAVAHWKQKLYKRPSTREKADTVTTPSTVSSSNSTLRGDERKATKDISTAEREPLLSFDTAFNQNQNRSLFSRIRSYLKSFILYQPRPRFALTAPVNKLPSNGTSLAILVVLAINIFYLFFRCLPSVENFQILADRAGLCFVANLPVLYLLAAKSNKVLAWLTGWSYEGLNIFHRRIGEWMMLLLLLHVAGMITLWYIALLPRGMSLAHFLKLKIIWVGLAAFFCMIAIWLTSIGYVRRKAYEVFLACHIVFQVAGLSFLFFHHHSTRWYTGSALAIWIVDRLSARSALLTKSLIANLEIAPDGKTTVIHVDVPLGSKKWFPGICRGWQAGQHVFITVPELGRTHRYQMHPFTIASPAPPPHPTTNTWPLQLIVRAMDGFSSEVLEYAKLHQHTKILVDGPYGSTEALEAVQRADRTLLIAGGSGISVTYPLAWSIHTGGSASDYVNARVRYDHGIKRIPRIGTSRPESDVTKHCHMWIRQTSQQQRWITLLPRHVQTTNGSEECAINLISKVFDTREDPAGRPDVTTEIEEWVKSGAYTIKGGFSARTCIVVSGPNKLARQVRNCVAKLALAGWNVDVLVESFEW